MKKLIAALALSAAALSVSGVSAAGAMVGYVSDSECASKSARVSSAAEWIKPALFEECVKKCLKEGSKAVFVTEDNKILQFDAASIDRMKPFHGHKVSVVGKVTGTTLTVETITDLKLQ